MKEYLKNKDYIMQYIDNFFRTFANSIYAVFTPVILYKSGVNVTMIIFIYMIQFLVMGIFSPLSGTCLKKIGAANTKLLSYILKTLSMILVLTVDTNIYYYLAIAIVYGISGAINNPLNTYIPGKLVKENFRGRFNAFIYILRCFSSILGYIFVGVFLTRNNNLTIALSVFFSYLIAYIGLAKIDKNKLKYEMNEPIKESYKYLVKKHENTRLKLVSGLRSCIIIERLIAVPLYLYITLMDLKTFNIISIIKGIVTSIFILSKNLYLLMVNQSVYKLVDNVYDSAYSALSQSKVENDKKSTILLSIIHEMCLCFFEFIVLLMLLIISIFNVEITFKVMFASSIVVIIINAILIKRWN